MVADESGDGKNTAVKPLVISGAFSMKMMTIMRRAMSMSVLPDPDGLGCLSLQ